MPGFAHHEGMVCPACGGDYGVIDRDLGWYVCFCGNRGAISEEALAWLEPLEILDAAAVPVEDRARLIGPGPGVPAVPKRRRWRWRNR